ncbi:ATP-binding protein [Flexithrix dorotheae]|uniref:ATP-binding protein n=1 Tax=Flexithrix dorotheae TaxID=70993 RepID=UPI0003620BE5|nr:ATP-binding protein [Flexithrix dorotheae]
MNVQAKEEFVLPFSKEELFFKDENGSYSVQYEDLGGNTILITRKGFASLQSVQGDLVIAEKILKEIKPYLKVSGIYFILDVRLYEGVSRKGRNLFLEFEKKLDKENLIDHVSVVGGVSYVLNMIRLATYFFRNFSISFHDDLAGATAEIQKYKLNSASLIDDSGSGFINTEWDSSWLNRKHIYSNGKKISLLNRPEWNLYSESGNFFINVFLLGADILLIKDFGRIPGNLFTKVIDIFEKVFFVAGKEQVYVITDISEFYLFDKGFKKILNKSNKTFINHWNAIYKVSSNVDKVKFFFTRLFSQNNTPPIVSVKSIHEGIACCLQNKGAAQGTDIKSASMLQTKEDLERLSKRELITLVEAERRKRADIEKNQRTRINELIGTLGRVSWSQEFEPQILNISSEDPFFDLFNTSNLLQQDVYEVLRTENPGEQMFQWEEGEMKAKQDQLNLKTFLENNDNTIWLINDKYELTDCNQNFLRVYYARFNVKINVGDNIFKTTPSNLMNELWKKRYDKALSGESCEYIDKVINQKGNENILLFKVFPIKLNKKITGVIVISHDITVNEQAAEILRVNKEMLDNIFNAMNVGMVLVNEHEQIERVNQYFCGRFGYDQQEILNRKLDEILASKAMEKLKDLNEKLSFESQGIQKNGNKLDIFITGAPFKGEANKPYKIVTINDISKRKKAENDLKEKNQELEKVNKELDQFVYSVSHDLMAPLNSILGLITLSKLETDVEKIQEYIRLKEKSVIKLNEFIQDLIDLSRDTRLEIQKENIDFNILLEELAEKYEYGENSDQVTLSIEVNQDYLFFSDKNRLKVILGNLISNAFRYAMPHKPDSYVKVSVEVGNSAATLKVEDNGIGIKEGHRKKVFGMFFRASQDIKGSGLGLYIVSESVSRLNGKIDLKSQVGEGSTFTISLPNLN